MEQPLLHDPHPRAAVLTQDRLHRALAACKPFLGPSRHQREGPGTSKPQQVVDALVDPLSHSNKYSRPILCAPSMRALVRNRDESRE